MKNRFTRILAFLLIVASLSSFLGLFSSAATETDSSVKMFHNRTYNEGWEYDNGLSASAGLDPFVNHEYDDDYNYNYYVEITDAASNLAGGKLGMTIPSANRPTSGKTVLSFALKLPKSSSQNYGTVVSAKTASSTEYEFLTINNNQIYSLGTLLGTVYNDEWIQFEFIMVWDDDVRACTVNVEGGGLSVSETLPLVAGQEGASLSNVYIGMGARTELSEVRTMHLDDLVLYNVARNVIAKEDLHLYGVGSLVKDSATKTVEIYGATNLAPTDYIKRGLTMKVGVNWYMTEVETDSITGAKAHKKLNIYTAENGKAYGAPVKVDGVVYVPLMLVLDYLGYDYKDRENSIEISTGGTTSVSITVGSKSAAINGQRVEMEGAPGFVTTVVGGVEYKYLVVSMDSIELFFAQDHQENKLYVTYDDMGLMFLTGKDNVWHRSTNLSEMATLMEKFIFDYDYENKGKGFGEQLYKDMKEYSNFQHPYLFANQDRWNTLRAVWFANDAEAYARLMALSDAEKAELEITNADPNGYSDTLRTWVRNWIKPSVTDPGYLIANGEYVIPDEAGVEIRQDVNLNPVESCYAAANGNLILDEEGNYLGMMPSTRASIVNHNLPENGGKYDDGYDAGGRFSLNTNNIQNFARYYQITRDLRYAQYVYDHMCIIGDKDIWVHWGPTHFLNTADGTTSVAITYDWLCPAWDKLVEKGISRPVADMDLYAVTIPGLGTRYTTENREGLSMPNARLKIPSHPEFTTYNRKNICDIIMEQGVHEGWLSQVKNTCEHVSLRCTGGFEWKSNTDNWNPVCTKGMALGGMMTLEYEDHRKETMEMFDEMMYWFFVNGLNEYAPDGSYYESASYWAYGTNAAFQMAAAFVSATNYDYGIMDCYGFDKTCYFAAYVESSDAMIWSYNDCGGGGNAPPGKGGMDTSWFIWVGKYIGDPGLIEHRIYQIESGLKSPSLYDVFNYEESYSGVDSIDLPLSYYMEGLNTYCGAYNVRSSWEQGAMCFSIIGGTNAVAHADVDAGAFMYWNKGKAWIWDLGADNYNLTSFFGTGFSGTLGATLPNRFRYYRHGAEGNNVVVLASQQTKLPFGQRVNGVSPLDRQYADDYGAYAVYEMIDIYSSEPKRESNGTKQTLVAAAMRGVLATDNYQTAILQDEILAKSLETFYWFAHFSDFTIETTFSDDGRVCYMRYKTAVLDEETGKSHYDVLRLTIVSPDSSDKFYVTGAGDEDMVFDATFRYGTHQNYPEQKEGDRSTVRRLCIKRADKLDFRVAVVFEMLPYNFYDSENGIVTPAEDTYPCSYTWTDMYAWETKAAPEYDFGDDSEETGVNETLKAGDLTYYASIAKKYDAEKTAYNVNFYNFFAAISRVQRAWNRFEHSSQVKPFQQGYTDCEDYIRTYNRIQRQMNQNGTGATNIATVLAGIR